MNKSIFLQMSSWIQLLCLLFLFLWCTVIFSFLIALLPYPADSVEYLRIAQFIQQIGLFLVPACVCAWLFNEEPIQFLKINRPLKFNVTIVSVLFIFVIQPLVNVASYFNNQIQFPASLQKVEELLRSLEDLSQSLLETMMGSDTVASLLISLFIISIMAAVTEEVFFRGILQQLINKITVNYHLAVWITAIIFSAIHFQFFGFFPRVLLGALLGYLFVWSGNLWVPIIVHAVNNAIGVLLIRYKDSLDYEFLETLGLGSTWWVTLLSCILSALCVSYLVKEYNKLKYSDF